MKTSVAGLVFLLAASLYPQSTPRLVEWERGIALQSPEQSDMAMYFWFYEWNMFEAMAPGQHTNGTYRLDRKLDQRGTEAVISSPAIRLTVRAISGGADLVLRITNLTSHDWPEIAGIIPCWNPGRVAGTDPSKPLPLNRQFADPEHNKTFFLSPDGLAALTSRAIHFNQALRAEVDQASDQGKFVFSQKWPTSDVNAKAGVLIRESEDGKWVTGIGWEDFLSVQGHNPWYCMHACIRVGPLKQKQSKTIRGRLYLFRGNKAGCLARFVKDFGIRP